MIEGNLSECKHVETYTHRHAGIISTSSVRTAFTMGENNALSLSIDTIGLKI
jgi:hypothetical protein